MEFLPVLFALISTIQLATCSSSSVSADPPTASPSTVAKASVMTVTPSSSSIVMISATGAVISATAASNTAGASGSIQATPSMSIMPSTSTVAITNVTTCTNNTADVKCKEECCAESDSGWKAVYETKKVEITNICNTTSSDMKKYSETTKVNETCNTVCGDKCKEPKNAGVLLHMSWLMLSALSFLSLWIIN